MPVSERAGDRELGKAYGLFAGAFAFLIVVVALLAEFGLPEAVSAFLVILVSLLTYSVLGVSARTLGESDFLAAGRSLPASVNGLATAAAFLSIGGFAGLAGVFLADARAGAAVAIGWSVGLALLAVLIAPYFRNSGAVTLPDFLANRFGGRAVRAVAVAILLLTSLAGLVAAIGAAASIAGPFLGVPPIIAVAGVAVVVLASSLLGGLRAASLVAAAQCIVLLVGLLVPGIVVSAREYGLPLAQLTYGYALQDAGDGGAAVIGTFAGRFLPLPDLDLPNLFALAVVMAAATASLPHIVPRSAGARSAEVARQSIAWALVAVLAVILTAPALAAFVKLGIARDLVGSAPADLPGWMTDFGRRGLVRICGAEATSLDAIRAACAGRLGPDGTLRAADIAISTDLVVPAFASVTGLPYVMAVLIAAGGLAAALAGATALAVTIAATIGHDLYGRLLSPRAPAGRRIILTRLALLVIVGLAAWLAGRRTGAASTLALLSLSFIAAGFFPALVLGIWWRRTTPGAALAGMVAGIGITLFYTGAKLWSGSAPTGFPKFPGGEVSPLVAAVYGIPLGLIVIIGVSLATPGGEGQKNAVDAIRQPERRPLSGGES